MGRRAVAVRLRVAARRPASWLACIAAAGTTWWLGRADATPAAAILGGALVAAAALGSLPRDPTAAAWAAARAAWPLVGMVIGWLAGGLAPAWPGCAAAVACVATVAAITAATRAGFPPAAATGGGLALAAAAASAAFAADLAPQWLAPAWPLAATAAWVAASGLFALVGSGSQSDAPVVALLGGAVPPALMASALVAMVVCLFLTPQLAWGYAAVAAGWLLVSGLPRAALGPGSAGDGPRRGLIATAAGRRSHPAVVAAWLMAAQAAVLVWPPLVAALLAGVVGAAEPLAIAAAIAAGAGGLAAVSAAPLAAGWSRDTALALAVCATLAAAACGRAAAFTRESAPRTDVEQSG